MRFKKAFVSLFLALLLLSYGGVAGGEIRQGDECEIEGVVEGDLFVLCRTLTIRGTIQGNLLGAATSAKIPGTVEGSVYLLAGELDVSGTIRDDLHFIGPVLRLNNGGQFSSDDSDLISLSLSTNVARTVTIPGSLINLGYQLLMNGNVDGSVSYWGSTLSLQGSVAGNVDAAVGGPQPEGIPFWQTLITRSLWDTDLLTPGLNIPEQGSVGGNLRYTGPIAGTVTGTVGGETTYTQLATQPDLSQIIGEERGSGREMGVYLAQAINELITLAVIGLIGVRLLPRPMQHSTRYLQTRPLTSLGGGLLSLVLAILTPILFILVGVVVMMLLYWLQLNGLLAVAAALFSIGSLTIIGLAAFLVLVVSRIIAGLFIGQLLVRIVLGDDGSLRITVISLIVGILLLALVVALPSVGWLFNLAAIFLGLGALFMSIQTQVRLRYSRSPVQIYRVSPSPVIGNREPTRSIPPPVLGDSAQGVGMDNLPEGFRWWDD